MPTAPVAAASFLVSWGVVAASGSRIAGGVVLAAGGLWCIGAWRRRQGNRTAAILGVAGLIAFVLSHVLDLAIGAWPSVILVALAVGAIAWAYADAKPGLSAR